MVKKKKRNVQVGTPSTKQSIISHTKDKKQTKTTPNGSNSIKGQDIVFRRTAQYAEMMIRLDWVKMDQKDFIRIRNLEFARHAQ